MSSMGGHGHHGHALGPERLERLYRAQLVWDETMAASVDAALADGYAAVVVCAGVGHITHGHGIPARIGGARWLTVQPVASAEEAVALAVDAPYPERVADLFWVP